MSDETDIEKIAKCSEQEYQAAMRWKLIQQYAGLAMQGLLACPGVGGGDYKVAVAAKIYATALADEVLKEERQKE